MGTGVNVVKFSMFFVDVGKYFKASLLFAAKAGAYPSGAFRTASF